MRSVSLCSLLCLLLLLVSVDGQRYFTEVLPTTEMWAARDKANVELVRRTTTFRDGVNGGRATTLTNYMLLYGGSTDSGGANDVWASVNGRAWVWVAGISDGQDHPVYADTFPNNEEAAHCQDTTYRQYRAGGRYPGQEPSNDVWVSNDGMRWTEQTPAAEWDPRYLASMVGDSTGAIYIAGGILLSNADRRTTSGEVWRSVNQGRVWRQVNTEDTIASGAGVRAVSLLLRSGNDRLIWMTGVNSGYVGTDYESYNKDVWASTNQGRTFYPVNLNSAFGRRDDANGEITDAGLIILAGGYAGTLTGEIYNDVWVSPNGGYTWGICVTDAEWDDRRYQMTLLDMDGYLWVMGGSRAGRNQDLWRSVWSFNDMSAVSSRCGVSTPSCGLGLTCLPNATSTLVAADGKAVYCDDCPYNFGTPASVQVALAFLIVFAVMTVLVSVALCYTFYRLRAAGLQSPIPLPAGAQRWWDQKGSAGLLAAGETDSAAAGAAGGDTYKPLRVRDQF